MKVTIRDVAKHAGVSVATVSRVLTGRRRVAPELAERVSASAAELGYRHNAVASALRRGHTDTMGMVVPEIGNPFFPTIVEAIERHLQDGSRDLFLCDARQDVALEKRRILALVARQVDGLIMVPVSAEESRAALAEAVRRVPVVQVDRYVEGLDADWVGVDDRLGISLAVEHVSSLGARNCAFVSATTDSSSAQRRLAGFEDASARFGLGSCAVSPLLGEFTAEWGRTAAARLASCDPLPDAVVCGNDEIALGVLAEFHRRRIAVPDTVLVTGFDDIRFASLADPPLTTVRQPAEEIAAEAIRLLDERIANPGKPARRIALAPVLVVRGSTVAEEVSGT